MQLLFLKEKLLIQHIAIIIDIGLNTTLQLNYLRLEYVLQGHLLVFEALDVDLMVKYHFEIKHFEL